MKNQIAVATLGAALVLAGAPALASAADAVAGPIHIDSVQAYGGGFAVNAVAADPTSAKIGFTNEYGYPAADVEFALFSQGAEVAQYDDRGSFANGVAIGYTFPEDQPTGDLSAAVVKATFADGTTWQNPELPDVQPAANVAVQAVAEN